MPALARISLLQCGQSRTVADDTGGGWSANSKDGWDTAAVAPQEGHRIASAEISTPQHEQYCIPGLGCFWFLSFRSSPLPVIACRRRANSRTLARRSLRSRFNASPISCSSFGSQPGSSVESDGKSKGKCAGSRPSAYDAVLHPARTHPSAARIRLGTVQEPHNQ